MQTGVRDLQQIARKTYYTDYAIHAWRFYLENPDIEQVAKTVYKQNLIADWNAANHIWADMNDIERMFAKEVYLGKDTIPDNVYALSQRSGTGQNDIWRVLRDCERKLAHERGLI